MESESESEYDEDSESDEDSAACFAKRFSLSFTQQKESLRLLSNASFSFHLCKKQICTS